MAFTGFSTGRKGNGGGIDNFLFLYGFENLFTKHQKDPLINIIHKIIFTND